jgi:hypothetical protein
MAREDRESRWIYTFSGFGVFFALAVLLFAIAALFWADALR